MIETEPEHGFALRALVREVLEYSSDPDPRIVAGEILVKIADEDLRAACASALPEFVRHVIAAQRNRAVGTVGAGGTATMRELPGAAVSAGRSWKVAALQDYGRALKQRIHVGPKPTAWKFLGDCEHADLRFVVEERRATAARTNSAADLYEQVIVKLLEHQAARVRDLPVPVLTELFGGAE